MFEKRMLSVINGSETVEITGGQTKMDNVEIYNLYHSTVFKGEYI